MDIFWPFFQELEFPNHTRFPRRYARIPGLAQRSSEIGVPVEFSLLAGFAGQLFRFPLFRHLFMPRFEWRSPVRAGGLDVLQERLYIKIFFFFCRGRNAH
jgi:hypothetical protein